MLRVNNGTHVKQERSRYTYYARIRVLSCTYVCNLVHSLNNVHLPWFSCLPTSKTPSITWRCFNFYRATSKAIIAILLLLLSCHISFDTPTLLCWASCILLVTGFKALRFSSPTLFCYFSAFIGFNNVCQFPVCIISLVSAGHQACQKYAVIAILFSCVVVCMTNNAVFVLFSCMSLCRHL